jgi:putative DNA primase/helicase
VIDESFQAAREAERALLGALLVAGASGEETPIAEVQKVVKPNDFLDHGFPDNLHSRIFQAMVAADKSDQISVAHQLNAQGRLQKGDCSYLLDLLSEVAGIEWEQYARSVHDYAENRRNGAKPGKPISEFAFGCTDLGNAERLVRQFGDVLHYCYERNRWLIWTGKVWEWDAGAKITAMAKLAVRNIYHEAGNEPDEKKRKELANHAKSSESDHRINAMINQARSELGIPVKVTELDTNPWVFNCLNGTIDLKTGQLLPHRKEDLLTIIVPVEYHPDTSCPRWLSFLDRVTAGNIELQSYLQCAVGYSLTGDVKSQVFFFLYGLGTNGKSTFVTTIRKLAGEYGERVNTDLFMLKDRNAGGPKESLANLKGKRFVAASELEDGQKLAVSLVKDMTGGESIKADRKYEHEIEYQPTHKIWLVGNHKPVVTDTTLSIWRRVKLIPFAVTIPSEEVDIDLPSKLEVELPGILSWAIKGCLGWQQYGLKEPDAVTTATASYRHDQDTLGDFIEDCCMLDPLVSIPKSKLREEYHAWCLGNSIIPETQKDFKARLIERGITDSKVMSTRYWRGITLKSLVPKKGELSLEMSLANQLALGTRGKEIAGNPYMSCGQKSFLAEQGESCPSEAKSTGSLVPLVPNADDDPQSYPRCQCPQCGDDKWAMSPEGQYVCPGCSFIHPTDCERCRNG